MLTRRNMLKGAAASLAVFAGLGLAACNNAGNNSNGDGANNAASGPVEITIPSYKTGENVGAVFFEPQVERFNKKYEGTYKINLESVPEDSFKDRLKQLAQQKKLPALVQGGDFDWLRDVVFPNGQAYDLAGWLDATPEVKDVLLDDSLDYCTTSDGKVFSMPLATVRPTGFFWNSALWSADDPSAMTMDDFLASIADQKIAFSTAENAWVSSLFLTALIAAEDGGAEWLRNGIDTQIVDFNEPAFLTAAEKLQGLLQNNAAPGSIGAAYADAANSFMSGQAALIANGPWMSSDFAAENSKNWSNGFDGSKVRAALFPGDVGIAKTRSYGEWWIASTATDDEVKLAQAFLAFINTQEELEAYLLAEGGDAPKLSYSASFKEEQAKTQVLADLAADTTDSTVFVPAILDVIPASVANTELGKLLPSLADGSYTPESFAEWLTTKSAEATAE